MATSIAAAAHAGGTPAQAAAGLQELSELNLVVFGDVHVNGGETEGPMFVGGDLYANGYQVDFGASAHSSQGFTASSYEGLTVLGNINGGGIHLQSGAYNNGAGHTVPNLTVGGNITNDVELNSPNLTVKVGGNVGSISGSPGSNVQVGGMIGSFTPNTATGGGNVAGLQSSLQSQISGEKSTLSTDLNALASQLSLLSQTGSLNTADMNDTKFIAAPSGVTVIDITAAQLEAAKSIDFSGLGGATTIINVTGITAGQTYDFSANSNNNSAYDQKVIWNFGETAATLDFQTQVDGSILAPNDAISNSTDLNGSVVAASFTQGGEVHLGTYNGTNPFPPPTGSVPEPATWSLMILGLGMIGSALRRRLVPTLA